MEKQKAPADEQQGTFETLQKAQPPGQGHEWQGHVGSGQDGAGQEFSACADMIHGVSVGAGEFFLQPQPRFGSSVVGVAVEVFGEVSAEDVAACQQVRSEKN